MSDLKSFPKCRIAPVVDLKPYINNPRTHSRKQILKLTTSLTHYGFTNPILVDENNGILAGHGRLEAAKKLGMKEVPVICIDHMSEADKRAYSLADNKLAEEAGWDDALLAAELQGLLDLNIEIDLELTGFEMGEIDILLGTDTDQVEEEVPEPDYSEPAVSKAGDLWIIGPHRLFCGNCLDRDTWAGLLGSDKAQMVFTDPPYNVRVDGHITGLGQKKHREFAMASGEMSSDAFTVFLRTTFEHLTAFSDDGSIHFVCMDWRHIAELLAASEGTYTELKNLCVWAKTNAGMGSFYRSQHELVFAFKSGTAKHINNFGLGASDRANVARSRQHHTYANCDRANPVSRLSTELGPFTACFGSGVLRHPEMPPKTRGKMR